MPLLATFSLDALTHDIRLPPMCRVALYGQGSASTGG